MHNQLLHKPLYFFLIFGILIWGFVFLLIPAHPAQGLSSITILYVFISLLAYFSGYFICKNQYKTLTPQSVLNKEINNIIWIVIFLVFVSWIIRYFDLFFFRGVSFDNTIQQNRLALANGNDNFIFMLGAVFKELYFVPLLLTLLYLKENRRLIFVSSVLYLFPLLLPFLRGTRKDIFMVFIFLLITLIISKTISVKIKTILKIGISFIILNILFYNLLITRQTLENQTKSEVIDELIEYPIYNDLLQPRASFKEKIKSSTGYKKAILFNYLHTLQYYCHGIFELDYLINHKSKNNNYLKGEYNFNLFLRALEKLNIINYDSSRVNALLPRESTYITFLGALFLDFGWFGIIAVFLLGVFQNIIDTKIKDKNVLYISLYVFFIVFNIFFPVINLLRGTGIYIVFSLLMVIFSFNILIKSKIRAYLSI